MEKRDYYAEVREIIKDWVEDGKQTIDSIRNDVTDVIDCIEEEAE